MSENSPRVRLFFSRPSPNGVTRKLDVIVVIGANKEMHPYQRTDKSYVPSGNLGRL